jgi:hypothetical protein
MPLFPARRARRRQYRFGWWLTTPRSSPCRLFCREGRTGAVHSTADSAVRQTKYLLQHGAFRFDRCAAARAPRGKSSLRPCERKQSTECHLVAGARAGMWPMRPSLSPAVMRSTFRAPRLLMDAFARTSSDLRCNGWRSRRRCCGPLCRSKGVRSPRFSGSSPRRRWRVRSFPCPPPR